MMNKKLCAAVMGCALAVSAAAFASPLVTSNISLDSSYYEYLDKLEGMGYIADMPTGTKPYSRLDVAKWLLEAEAISKDRPMPGYLKAYYNEMRQDLAEEIDYLQAQNKGEDRKFSSNIKLRSASVDFMYADMDGTDYRYKHANGSWQPLNHNNNGYRYGDGFNAVGKLNISGSLNKDFALSLTPRFSYDKDQHGDASLEEGYVKTHVGVWGVEVGRQPMQWGGSGHNSAFAISNNAMPQTMVKANLLEPHTFDNGFLKFLGKANINVFYSQLEGNRRARAFDAGIAHSEREEDNAGLLGIRVDVVPVDNLTIGLERVSMFKDFNKDWFFGDNADVGYDKWNDIAGLDFRYRFPGVQVYGSLYGEDQAGGFPSEHAYSGGLYFPQFIAQDGSWDLRLEASNTNNWWYGHATFVNGWTYHDDIMGDWMGRDTRKYYANVNHYFDNGDRIGLHYTYADMDRSEPNNPLLKEIQLTYAKKLKKNMYLDAALGYAKLQNAGYKNGNDDTSKLAAIGLRWEY